MIHLFENMLGNLKTEMIEAGKSTVAMNQANLSSAKFWICMPEDMRAWGEIKSVIIINRGLTGQNFGTNIFDHGRLTFSKRISYCCVRPLDSLSISSVSTMKSKYFSTSECLMRTFEASARVVCGMNNFTTIQPHLLGLEISGVCARAQEHDAGHRAALWISVKTCTTRETSKLAYQIASKHLFSNPRDVDTNSW